MEISKYILGTDFSHHNPIDLRYIGQQGFIFLKATEGRSYVDSKLKLNMQHLAYNSFMANKPFIGFYHYARPELNSAKDEAFFCLRTISSHVGNCMIALDIEGNALNEKNIEMWVVEWLEIVKQKAKTNPILYLQASALSLFPNIICDKKTPLWVACYSESSRKSKYKHTMNRANFIQLTSHPFDIDIFKGSPIEIAQIIQGVWENED